MYTILEHNYETIPEVFTHRSYTIIYVAIKSNIGWKAYKGGVIIASEEEINPAIIQRVAAYGRKLSKADASKYFPTMDITKYES